MGSTLSQKNAFDLAIGETRNPQKLNQTVDDHHSVKMKARDKASQSRKRKRTQSGQAGIDLHVNVEAARLGEQTQESEEQLQGLTEKGSVEDENNDQPTRQSAAEIIEMLNEEFRQQEEKKTRTVRDEVRAISCETRKAFSSVVKSTRTSAPSPSCLSSSVDMVFSEDEVPIELYPFSSDESVEETQLAYLSRSANNLVNTAFKTIVACTTPSAAAQESRSTLTTRSPELMTAEELAISVNRGMRKRKRKKSFSFSAPRNKTATRLKQERIIVPKLLALEKPSIPANDYAAYSEVDLDSDYNVPASPVYPDAGASHLYPSTAKGELWKWRDADAYFDPLVQGDLDNLARWRKENASFIAASSSAWCSVPGLERKRATLASILADASRTLTAHMDIPVRRGRRYRDVWEEADFFAQQKRDNSVEEIYNKGHLVEKQKESVLSAESVLESHRNLVYGYDDDLFEDYRCRLEDHVELYRTARRQEDASTEVGDHVSKISANEIVFDERVLPSYPISQLHPASLGLWKLRKNLKPDFSVVNPASLNRNQVPTRRIEEMRRHHQRLRESRLQQPDQLAGAGYDESASDVAHNPRCTITNSEITGDLPSFGNEIEEDEISKMLAASVRKLIPLSIQNWRIAQRVQERAACNIQCASILEGEAAVARELENVFLQLCPPRDSSADITVPTCSTGPTRQVRTLRINSAPHDMITYSVRHDIANNCSLAVAASVEFALRLKVGDVVDVLDRNGCWNYGEIMETYSESKLSIAKFSLLRFSHWSETIVEWIAASEGRILPQGVASGVQSYSVGPTRAHRVRICYDQCLARELERSFLQRQKKQATAASQILAQWQNNVVVRSSNVQQKTPQKRKRKS